MTPDGWPASAPAHVIVTPEGVALSLSDSGVAAQRENAVSDEAIIRARIVGEEFGFIDRSSGDVRVGIWDPERGVLIEETPGGRIVGVSRLERHAVEALPRP